MQVHSKGLALPVQLEIDAWSPNNDDLGPWYTLEPGQHVQGCLTRDGVYSVIVEDVPRIVVRQQRKT